MAYGLNDRVREQVSAFAGGTGAVTLPVAAVSGFQTFLSGWGASGTGEYCLVIGSQWEAGFGTLNAGGTTLTRTTTYNGSSGAGVAVNFSPGTMDCFGDIPAELAQHLNMREITVASATTCDIGAVSGSSIAISGVVTITGLGTKTNRRRFVRFSGALVLTHNGTSLILPGAQNITTAAGDTAAFASDASGNWRCLYYQPANSGPINGQIPFPATQNPSSNVNTLDDYEEGTFTPAFAFGGGVVGITYASRTGKYTKIGNLVHIEINMTLSSKGSSTGNWTITGLPFSPATQCSCGIPYVSGINATVTVQPKVDSAATVIDIQFLSSGNALNMSDANATNSTFIMLNFNFSV